MRGFVKELYRRNPLFFYLGIVLSLLFFAFLLTFRVCQHSSYEFCFWLKPCKFVISFALYVFTLGWFLEYLREAIGEKNIRRITLLTAFLVISEVGIILAQSWLGAVFNKNLHILGNVVIITSTVVTAWVGAQFFRNLSLTPVSYLWGIRGGFVIFILSGFLGAFLLGKYGPAVPDPNYYGIPFTRFSSLKDVLISLHFLGIHSLQILPFCCYFFQKQLGKRFVLASIALYAAVCLFLIIP